MGEGIGAAADGLAEPGSDADERAGTFAPRQVRRPREQVEEQIRAAILAGELRSGDRLPTEMTLAAQFNVSRTTVREALRSLSTQGLVHKLPGSRGGTFVNDVDYRSLGTVIQESVHNLLQIGSIAFGEVAIVRQYLEVPSARLAAANRSEDDLADLRRIMEAERVATVHDPDVPSLDAQFHGTIARASGNRVLTSLVHALHHETEPVHYLDLSPEVGRMTVRQHRKILEAISAQDPEAAEEAIIEHLSYLRRHLRKEST